VQVDGCEHWWFEDRGPQCTLRGFVDDATKSTDASAIFAYFQAGGAYLGKPAAFYIDKHGVFRVNHPGALGGDGMTQFGRALHALNIEIIYANSNPAKGRVDLAEIVSLEPSDGSGTIRRNSLARIRASPIRRSGQSRFLRMLGAAH
jgi:hypothetical protein